MTIPSANLVIAFDGTSLRIEAAGLNGMRQKVEGVSFTDLPIEIRAALLDQLDRSRAKARSDSMEIERQNIAYVAENHGVALARKIWGGERATSRTMRARLRYSSDSAGNLDPEGNLKKPSKPIKIYESEIL